MYLRSFHFGEERKLRSNDEQYRLNVRVLRAHGLRNADSGILGDVSDPFCECWYVTMSGGAHHAVATYVFFCDVAIFWVLYS